MCGSGSESTGKSESQLRQAARDAVALNNKYPEGNRPSPVSPGSGTFEDANGKYTMNNGVKTYTGKWIIMCGSGSESAYFLFWIKKN